MRWRGNNGCHASLVHQSLLRLELLRQNRQRSPDRQWSTKAVLSLSLSRMILFYVLASGFPAAMHKGVFKLINQHHWSKLLYVIHKGTRDLWVMLAQISKEWLFLKYNRLIMQCSERVQSAQLILFCTSLAGHLSGKASQQTYQLG